MDNKQCKAPLPNHGYNTIYPNPKINTKKNQGLIIVVFIDFWEKG